MIRPLGSNVLLKKKKDNTKSKSGFIMPQNSGSDTQIGIVESVGVDVEGLKAGDEVAFANFSGAEIGEFLLIAVTDLLGVIEKEHGEVCVNSVDIKTIGVK